MSTFLGFDGGGTKTDCVLLDGAGRVLAETTGGPSNPLRIGFAKSCAVLGDTARHVLAAAHKDPGNVRAGCAGLAGGSRPRVARRIASYLSHAFPQASVRVISDIELALDAAFGPEQGIVIVSGTGSAACGRNSAGQFVRAGGWGPWIGDEGSAYDIGRRAVEAALRARDHLGPETVLGEKILTAEEVREWGTLIERIAKRPDSVFPGLFALVAEAAALGDRPAQDILAAAAKALANFARSVVEQLGLEGQPFPLSKSGGVFGRSQYFDSALDAELARVAPGARIVPLQTVPARAAAELARKSISTAVAHG